MQIVEPTLIRFYRVAALIPLYILLFLYIFIPPHLFLRVAEGSITVYLRRYFHLITVLVRDKPGINTRRPKSSVATQWRLVTTLGIRIKDTHRAILCDARPLPVLFNKNANNSDNADPYIYIRDRVLHSSRIFSSLSIYIFLYEAADGKLCKKKSFSISILNIFITKILLNESQEMRNANGKKNVHWMIDRTSFELRDQWSVSMQINLHLIDYLSLFSFDSKESDWQWVKLKELKSTR